MASVTLNGNTYTDDADPATGLANGGHRTRFVPALSDMLVEVINAASSASAASTSAASAAGSAQTAANAPGTSATSTTSLAIGTGSKTLTVQAGKSLVIGMSVKIASTATPTNWMYGDITAYDSGTGALTVNVTKISGSGTVAAWTVSLSGAAAPTTDWAEVTGKPSAFNPIAHTHQTSEINGLVGCGGTTNTGNVTLTASSAAALTITPATPGLYVTLPDATTCSKGSTLFSVYNAGDYDYGVKDGTGTQLGWIRARQGAVIGLSDSSTAAGIWAYYGLEKTGITASYVNSTLANMGNTIRRIALDANRTCFLFGGTDCYAIVYDASTQAWGSATLVRSALGNGQFVGILQATDKVLVVSGNNGTEMQTVILSVNGTAITANTPTATTLTGSMQSIGKIIAVGTSWAVSYGTSTPASEIRAITVSGTTPTVGAASALPPANNVSAILFASGAIVRTLSSTASVIYANPFTVSGSTLSAGTAATATATAAPFRAFINGNGNIVCHYLNTTHYATIFKLTGTTEAASSVSLGTAPTNIGGYSDCIQITASKTVFMSGQTGNAQYFVNILTDTAGTASAGTEIAATIINYAGCAALGFSGNIARFYVNGSGSITYSIGIDCSGSSPTISYASRSDHPSGVNYAYASASDVYGVKHPNNFVAENAAYLMGGGGMLFSARFVGNQIAWIGNTLGNFNQITGVAVSNTESVTAITTYSTTGINIQRVEAAA